MSNTYLSPSPFLQFFDQDGDLLVGGQLFTYLNNTTAPAATYTDGTGTTPNTNPIILDAYGSANVWLPPGQSFTYVLSPSTDTNPPTNPIRTIDNVSSSTNLATVNFGIDTGPVNGCVATISGITSLFQGLCVTLDVANTNTGAATLNLNNLGAKPIVVQSGASLVAGILIASGQYLLQYTGSAWQILGLSAEGYIAQTANESAVSIVPLNQTYPEGYFLRYITSWAPNQADTASANTNALNNATKVAAYGKNPVVLPAGLISITGTWNCVALTAATTGTNGGLTVQGQGMTCTQIQYIGGTSNTGNAWDMTGLSYGEFSGFTFVGGSTTDNCPEVTMLMGSGWVNNARLYSIAIDFYDVSWGGFGDYIIYNAGAEQIDFDNCLLTAFRGPSFANAWPIVFVTSGTAPSVSSAIGTLEPQVSSMTDVWWHGAKSAMIFHGPKAIVFQFSGTSAGTAADIWFDGYFQVQTPSGTFQFMSDNSNGATGTLLSGVGGERMIMENAEANGALQMHYFSAATCTVRFTGHAASGYPLSAAPFAFTSTAVPLQCKYDWNPNEGGGGWTGGFLVLVPGTELGIEVRGAVPAAQLCAVSTPRLIGGYNGIGVTGQGTDYAHFSTSDFVAGQATNGTFNLTRTLWAGNRVSDYSSFKEGVWTTAAVGTGATNIITFPGAACLIAVTGQAVGLRFFDLVAVMYAGTPAVINSSGTGSPAARTYAIASNNQLTLAMASGTYAIQCTCWQFGVQT